MGAFSEIFGYLVQTFLSLYLLAMLLRFLLQLTGADFYNPLSQFIVKATNPLVAPLRKVLPATGAVDLSSLLLCLLLQMAAIAALLLLSGYTPPNIGVLAIWSVIGVASLVVNFYFFAILILIILSWVAPGTNNPAAYLLYQLTEPVMRPVRGMLPPMGGIDFSPILVIILINVMLIALRHMAAAVSLSPALVFGL